jgi:hypothetical protein
MTGPTPLSPTVQALFTACRHTTPAGAQRKESPQTLQRRVSYLERKLKKLENQLQQLALS